ncbi:hypothetical protein VTK26DRAFT_8076 [Humicola hyalothermophila]
MDYRVENLRKARYDASAPSRTSFWRALRSRGLTSRYRPACDLPRKVTWCCYSALPKRPRPTRDRRRAQRCQETDTINGAAKQAAVFPLLCPFMVCVVYVCMLVSRIPKLFLTKQPALWAALSVSASCVIRTATVRSIQTRQCGIQGNCPTPPAGGGADPKWSIHLEH